MALSTSAPAVIATQYIRAGAELHPEPWADLNLDAAWRDAQRFGGVDGGLLLQAEGDAPACRPDMWDQLDGLLLAWLTALNELAGGATEAVAVFPDTRIECELTRVDEATVAVRYEDVDATLPLRATQASLQAAATRLLAAAGADDITPALTALAALKRQEFKESA